MEWLAKSHSPNPFETRGHSDSSAGSCSGSFNDHDTIGDSAAIMGMLFDCMGAIDSGCFGTVYKAKHKLDGQLYAIKCVQLPEDYNYDDLGEIRSLITARSPYVVRYYNSWLTGHRLYIQMELCSGSLRTVLNNRCDIFRRWANSQLKPMKTIEYFITCNIYRELLECVQHLHQLKPALNHRDLKPENILIARKPRNGRFVVLGDFGLSSTLDKHVDYDSFSRNRDCVDVMALGRIGHEMFEFADDRAHSHKAQTPHDVIVKIKMTKLKSQITMMISPNIKDRPECRQVLARYGDWAVERNVVRR
ncbi:unnamed protein product [Medioppia subpectinata]|uniref:Protein kinase domain-containing protein n=1 Tax=Medioppia subpectinata TaxID=1979941 RepID=A0A7R9KLK3_9ACAR|nr:unnamed protein product [Medioppia subpectinata]CAG2105711.1 unnamed protein product [Medioppia subpectinata]